MDVDGREHDALADIARSKLSWGRRREDAGGELTMLDG